MLKGIALVFLLAFVSSEIKAMDYFIDTTMTASQWQAVIAGLQPGDTAFVHQGDYSYSNGWTVSLSGTSSAPITISGVKSENRAKFIQTNSAGANNLNIAGTYIVMDYLEFTGGSEGIRLDTAGISHSVFTNLIIHDTQSTGFTANFAGMVSDNITISYNEVYNTGTGSGECFYLGCSGNGCTFKNGKVLNNYCHDTLLAYGGSYGSGIQVKPGSYNNIIQDNVCYKTGGPCVLAYDDYDMGRNRIIGNLGIESNDLGFQATSGVDFINNIVFNSKYSGIGIQNAVDLMPGKTFRNVSIIHNTIVNTTNSAGAALYLTGVSSTTNWVISNNALYSELSTDNVKVSPYMSSQSDLTGVTVTANVYFGGAVPGGTTGLTASSGLYTDMQDPSAATYNVYPTSSGALVGNGDSAHSISYDYNGTPRSSTAPTIGAYEYTSATNPGAALGPGFKDTSTSGGTTTNSPTAGGTQSGGGSSSSSANRNFKAEWLAKLRQQYGLLL